MGARSDLLRYRQMIDLAVADESDAHRLDGTLYRHRALARETFDEFTVQVNSLGFRGPEVRRRKAKTAGRILVLGDSVTFGWGVDDEVTFVRRLEQALARRRGRRRYEVINTGHLLYDSTQQRAMLEEQGLSLHPDLVLLVFVANDLHPTRDSFELLLEAQAGRVQPAPATPAWQRALDLFAGGTPATKTLVARGFSTRPGGPAPDAPEANEIGARGWQRSQRALRAIQAACTRRGIAFVVLDHSVPAVRALPAFCARRGIPCHDLRFTAEESELPIYDASIYPHPTALGHELLLEKVQRALEAEGLP